MNENGQESKGVKKTSAPIVALQSFIEKAETFAIAILLEQAIKHFDHTYKKRTQFRWDPIRQDVKMPELPDVDQLFKALHSLAENVDIAELLTSEHEMIRKIGQRLKSELDYFNKICPEVVDGVRTIRQLLKKLHEKYGDPLPIFEDRGVSIGNPEAVAKVLLEIEECHEDISSLH